MKNKKGFTLIELLATIIILSIIFLFTTPKIISLIDNAEAQNKAIIEEKLIDAGKEYISEYNKAFLKDFKDVGTIAYINVEELIDAGLIDEKEVYNLGGTVSVKVELLADDIIDYSVYYAE